MKTLTAEANIAQKLRQMHYHRVANGESSESLKATFWAFYRVCEEVAFAELDSKMNVQGLAKPISQLMEYRKLLDETKWEDTTTTNTGDDDDDDVVEQALQAIVLCQINLMEAKQRSYLYSRWYHTRNQELWKGKKQKTGNNGDADVVLLTRELLSPPGWATM